MKINIIVPKASQLKAQEITGTKTIERDEEGNETEIITPSNLFTTELYTGEEVTHYISSGMFHNEELNQLLNSDCEKFVYFGEPEEAMKELNVSLCEQG